MPKSSFTDRYGPWALVTGASSGLGAEIAINLAQRGVHVILHGRDKQRLTEISSRIEHFAVQTRILSSDLGSVECIEELIGATKDIDIGLLVAAAGFGTSGAFSKQNLRNEVDMLMVNCRAALMLAHEFANRFIERRNGGIIMFGSLVGFQGTPYAAHYAATKAHMQVFAEGLHHELKQDGVDVLAVAPGPVATGFGERAQMNMKGAADPAPLARTVLNALGKRCTVKPGLKSKFLIGSLSLLPRHMRIHIMGSIMGGMTREYIAPSQ